MAPFLEAPPAKGSTTSPNKHHHQLGTKHSSTRACRDISHCCIAILLKLNHFLMVGQGRLMIYKAWEALESHRFTRPLPRVTKTVNSCYRGPGLVEPPGSQAGSSRDAAFSDHWCWGGPFSHTAAESSTLSTVTPINSLAPQARLGRDCFFCG